MHGNQNKRVEADRLGSEEQRDRLLECGDDSLLGVFPEVAAQFFEGVPPGHRSELEVGVAAEREPKGEVRVGGRRGHRDYSVREDAQN